MIELVHQQVRPFDWSGWRRWLSGLPFWAAAGLLATLRSSHGPLQEWLPGNWPLPVGGFLFGCGLALSLGFRPWAFGGIAPLGWAAAQMMLLLIFDAFQPRGLVPYVLCLVPAVLFAAALFPGLLYRRHGLTGELVRDLPLWALAIVLPILGMPWVLMIIFTLDWWIWAMAVTGAVVGTGCFLVTWSRFDGLRLIGVEG